MGWEGIGTLIGKVSDFIPGRREAMQNKMDKIKKEMYELQNKKAPKLADTLRYGKLADELQQLEKSEGRAK
jgi:hypothetical protein